MEDNSLMVEQREKEILQIVKSIQDLNEIFKDLAAMIVDQVCTLALECQWYVIRLTIFTGSGLDSRSGNDIFLLS